jgi:predicted DNA binding CopG/RHH family protein
LKERKLTVRCTDEEYRKIKEKAEKYGLGLSDYVRLVCLTGEIETKAEKK